MKQLWKLASFKSSKKLIFLYGSIILGFIIWMVFIDTYSWIIHSELNKEIEELEVEKKALKEIIKNDKKIIKQLKNKLLLTKSHGTEMVVVAVSYQLCMAVFLKKLV